MYNITYFGSWHLLDLTCEVAGRPWQVITTLTLIICVVPRTEDRCLASPQHHSFGKTAVQAYLVLGQNQKSHQRQLSCTVQP